MTFLLEGRFPIMMNHLKCSVENCANYCEHQCCLSQIEVAGPHSTNRQETCCDSFRCKDTCGCSGANNSTRHDVPNPNLEIRCTAEQCVHNHQGTCDAECVCVGIGDYGTRKQARNPMRNFCLPQYQRIKIFVIKRRRTKRIFAFCFSPF